MNRTSIEWVRNPDGTQGWTWNPIVGCSKGCSYCYARRIATTRLAHTCEKCATFEPHLHWERIQEPSHRKIPSGIFVCSMGEHYDRKLSWSDICRVHQEIEYASWHRFYVLTKEPRFALTPPANEWLGVSCDCQNPDADCARIELISPTLTGKEGKRFISFEPLLGVWIEPWGAVPDWINWIIIGAMTGPNAVKPKREWVTDIIEKADAAGIPIFLKNNLLKIYPDLPERQEMPS